MKSYLKPYTACTTVEFESLLQTDSKGGHGNPLNPGNPPCPPSQNPSTGKTEGSWGSVKAGNPSPAVKENYFIDLEY